MIRIASLGFLAMSLLAGGVAVAQPQPPAAPAATAPAAAPARPPRTPMATKPWDELTSRQHRRLMGGMPTGGGPAITADAAKTRWEAMNHADRMALVRATKRHRAPRPA